MDLQFRLPCADAHLTFQAGFIACPNELQPICYHQIIVMGIKSPESTEAIKDCIRRNEHVAITLYRDFAPVAFKTQPSVASKSDEGVSSFR